jgi:hypothetical protein
MPIIDHQQKIRWHESVMAQAPGNPRGISGMELQFARIVAAVVRLNQNRHSLSTLFLLLQYFETAYPRLILA